MPRKSKTKGITKPQRKSQRAEKYPSISVVVPAYNSQESLPLLVTRLEKVLSGLTSEFELILVDDGSHDQTWQVIEDLANKYLWVTGIKLMRNFGQHNALLCGIREASYELIVTMDDDLQNPPEEIPSLMDKFREDIDVVYGTPIQEKHNFWRNIASQVTKYALQNAMGAETARKVSAFRAFRSKARKAFITYGGAYVNIDVMLSWATTRFSSIEVAFQPRQTGKSNYTIRKLIIHALNMITGFSMVPLQIASMTGFIFTLFGVLVLIYVVGRYLLEGGVVQGFAFLASIITIFAGAQLFALGVMGEYLARMHFRLMDLPTYVIETNTNEQNRK